MSKIISSIVALMLGAALAIPTIANAAVGQPFLHGVTSPADLAKKIEGSLAKDAKGTIKLDPVRCDKVGDGSCATPLNYLQALQKVNPGAHLTDVIQVPDFLRALQVVDAPAGKYWISCLKATSQEKVRSQRTFRAEIHCLERAFKKGEKAWIDQKSGIIVFASDCTNVVEKPVIPPKLACVEIHFTTKPGDTAVRFALLGPADVKDDCIAVKRAGETDFERWWPDDCPDVHCGFREDARVVGQPVRIKGSYSLTPGEHILRLPAFVAEKSLYVTVLCLDRGVTVWPEMPSGVYTQAQVDQYKGQRDQWIAGHSDGIGIRWFEYLNTAIETKVATIWYTKAEGPRNAPYWPWGEWAKLQQQQGR